AALPWFSPADLTYSFAPDGTQVGSERSSLFAELAPTGSEQDWQAEVARAFNQWLSILGDTASLKADSGAPFGSFGQTQGDDRFGDIRIAAIPLSRNVMAEAIPHSIIAQGAWAGDILLNSNADWSNLQQVYSVALHEFGHVLGLGHSTDPLSPLYAQGNQSALAPTTNDANDLKKLYAGVNLHDDDNEVENSDQWRNEPKFSFDAGQAVPLSAVLSASARYAASGSLTTNTTSVLFRLDPIGEIDHAEFLNVVISSTKQNGLIPNVTVYDKSGDRIPSKILHNSEGVLVIQARDVDPNQSYYVAVTPIATTAQYQVGSFQLFAEYSMSQLLPTAIGSYALTATHPIVEQKFTVNTSRLIHLLVSSESMQSKIANAAVWGTLVNSQNQVVAQLALNIGDTRSAPLAFLNPDQYRLILQTGTSDASTPVATTLKVYIDEISVDVGPGIMNPITIPIDSTCQYVGGLPAVCPENPKVILVEGPLFPNPAELPPAPTYPSLPPWNSPPLFYWPIPLAPPAPVVDSPHLYFHNPINALDVSGDQMVTPLDALLVINELNATSPTGSISFLDTNADGLLSPIDVLLVINLLNASSSVSNASGEASVSILTPAEARNSAAIDQVLSGFNDWELPRKRKL
ncbi:MAG: dockerin type I domain-containing protein, partial [Aureliella sp.]